jgi:hypothetical protein
MAFFEMYRDVMKGNAQQKLLEPVFKSGVSYDNYYDQLRKKYFEFESTNKKHGMPKLKVHKNVDLNMVIHEFKIAKELRTQAWKAKSSRLYTENGKSGRGKANGRTLPNTQSGTLITEEAGKKILKKHMLDENLGYNTNYGKKFKDFLKKNQSTIEDTQFRMTPRESCGFETCRKTNSITISTHGTMRPQ